MSRGSQLYNLINSLSRGEKRQYKLQASKYAKDKKKNIAAQLFEILDGMSSWDTSLFKQKTINSGIDKHVSVHVNTLFSQVLESLRQKESESNTVFSINKLMEESLILFSRDEFGLALKRIQKAKQITISAELYEKMVEILNIERDIQFRLLGTVEYNKYRITFNNDVKNALTQIENQNDYLNLVEDIFYIYRTIGYPQVELEKSQYSNIIDNPLLKNDELALNSSAKSSFYFVFTIYYLGLNNLKKASEIVQKQVAVYEVNRKFLEAHISTYISILNNLLVLQSQLDSVENFRDTLKKLRSIPAEFKMVNKFIERRIFESSYSAELDFYIIKDLINQMEPVIPIVEENISKLGKEGVSYDRFLNLALRVAIYYYRTDNIDKAHHWVKMIVEYEGAKSTIHIISYAILLDLILHFQLGDYNYLQYRISTVQNFFKKHKRLIKINELFFKTLKQLLKSRNMENVDRVLNKYRQDLEACPDSITKRYFEKYLAIDKWLDRKFDMAQKFR